MIQDRLDFVLASQGGVGERAEFAELLAVAGVEVAASIHELSPVTEIIPHVGSGFGAVAPGLRKQLLKRRYRVQPAPAGNDRNLRTPLLRVPEQPHEASGEVIPSFTQRRGRTVGIGDVDIEALVSPVVA